MTSSAIKTEKLALSSPAFADGEWIPRKYSGEGSDVSPPLSWTGLPPGTKELVLIVDDPDAPTAEPWVHWVLYGLSPEINGLPEAVPLGSEVRTPVQALQGKTSKGNIGYHGPIPPPGRGLHHYHFKLYAVDRVLALSSGVDKRKLEQAMRGHIIGQAELVGTYER